MYNTYTKDIIKNQTCIWVDENLGHFTFRKYQLEYIVDVIYNILNGINVNYIEAPTGAGKSIMIIIMAGVLNDFYDQTSYILCSDLYLWNQYAEAIDRYKLKGFGKIKGLLGNYICNHTKQDIMTSPCRLASISFGQLRNKKWATANKWKCALTCNYIKERFKAISSRVTLMTYQLWFEYMMICEGTYGGDAPFNHRNVLFCDEAHKVPVLCQEARAICIDLNKIQNETRELLTYCHSISFDLFSKLDFMQDLNISKFLNEFRTATINLLDADKDNQDEILKTLGEYQNLLSSYPVRCYNALKDIYASKINNEGERPKLSKQEFKIFNIAKKMDAQMCDINKYFAMSQIMRDQYNNVKTIIKTDNKVFNEITQQYEWPEEKITTLKFAKEDYLVFDTVLRAANSVIMLSATIGNKEVFDDVVGIKYNIGMHSELLKMPSTFDFSKSPIYYLPGRRMSKDYIGVNFSKNASLVNRILKSKNHINEKGIIHTGSYKNAWDLYNMLEPDVQKRIFIYSDSKEKHKILARFARSQNGILIGPTLTEGIDLPQDGCRIIIIFKIPYPYLGDELVKAKIAMFPKWYTAETSKNIIQGVGRGNRTPDDWCTTYILDGCFGGLFAETKSQYSEEFISRLKVINIQTE